MVSLFKQSVHPQTALLSERKIVLLAFILPFIAVNTKQAYWLGWGGLQELTMEKPFSFNTASEFSLQANRNRSNVTLIIVEILRPNLLNVIREKNQIL